jgi:hypothetical protein
LSTPRGAVQGSVQTFNVSYSEPVQGVQNVQSPGSSPGSVQIVEKKGNRQQSKRSPFNRVAPFKPFNRCASFKVFYKRIPKPGDVIEGDGSYALREPAGACLHLIAETSSSPGALRMSDCILLGMESS